GELPERQARVVARIAASADPMARMIDDLLDFARSRLGGEFPIHRRRIDLRQICEQTVEELEFAYTRQVKLEVYGDPWGDWDPDRMAQVISNLVGNAVQHSEGEVEVTLRGEKDFVVLERHNRGTPIPRVEVAGWGWRSGASPSWRSRRRAVQRAEPARAITTRACAQSPSRVA